MSLKEFNKLFGIEESPELGKAKFVQRINQSLLSRLESTLGNNGYESIFRVVCYALGVNAQDIIRRANNHNYGYSTIVPSLTTLTSNDFLETLKILVIIYEEIDERYKGYVSGVIELALSSSESDLGVRWKDGLFYPSGAKELDQKLISDNLAWLEKYPEAKKSFSTSLQHFKKSLEDESARKDAITNSYTSVENLARVVLDNKKSFDKNSDQLVEALGLPTEYKQILHYYKKIAHEYSSRHAGSDFSHIEAEGFIYLTGLLLRLMGQKANVS